MAYKQHLVWQGHQPLQLLQGLETFLPRLLYYPYLQMFTLPYLASTSTLQNIPDMSHTVMTSSDLPF